MPVLALMSLLGFKEMSAAAKEKQKGSMHPCSLLHSNHTSGLAPLPSLIHTCFHHQIANCQLISSLLLSSWAAICHLQMLMQKEVDATL